MTALGQSETSKCECSTSVCPPAADLDQGNGLVSFVPKGDECTATWWLERKGGPIVARAAASAMSRRRRKGLHVRDFGPDERRRHWALPQNRRSF
jgi:hypothetical protein